MLAKLTTGYSTENTAAAFPTRNLGGVQMSQTQNLGQIVTAAVSNNNQGVYSIAMPVIEKGDIPRSTAYSVTNSNADGATEKTVYVFNEDTYNTTVVGGTNITSKTYNDGFTGKHINRILSIANGGKGLKCKGFNIIFKDASGNQDSGALETAQLTIQSYTGIGGKVDPTVIDLSEALRNTAFQQGLLTIDCEFWVNGVTQVTFNVPKGYSATINFKWDA